MKILTYRGYSARVEFDADDEVFAGRIEGISDIVGFHASYAFELVGTFHEAVDDYLATCDRIGREPQRAALLE